MSDNKYRPPNTELPQPWLQIDRESENRVNDLDGTRADADVGVNALGGSKAQTGWARSDVPDGRAARYEWLEKLQYGYGESERQAQKKQADLERMIETVCGQLGIADSHREQISWLFEQLSIQQDLGRQLSVEAAVLAATTLVVDTFRSQHAPPLSDAADGRVSLPKSLRRESQFKALQREYGVTSDGLTTTRERIRNTEQFENFRDRVRA